MIDKDSESEAVSRNVVWVGANYLSQGNGGVMGSIECFARKVMRSNARDYLLLLLLLMINEIKQKCCNVFHS